MVIRRPTQTPALRSDFIVATPQEFYQTEPVPEWIGHDSNAAPIVGAYFTLEARTSVTSLNNRRLNFRHHKVQVDWCPGVQCLV